MTAPPDRLPRASIKTYQGAGGCRLHYRHWLPAAARPLCRIVALHGIQSHSGWYGYSSGRWCAAGCELFFLDRRGSGMNEAARGDAPAAEALIDDVVEMLREVRGSNPQDSGSIPVVLLGVSWGGKLAFHVAARRPDLIDGLALLYPGLRAYVRANGWQNFQLSLADWLRLHRRCVPIPLDDPALFAGDPHWQAFIRHDPLALREVTVSFLLANRRLDRELDSCAPRIRAPLLLALAGGDEIIDNDATRRLIESCPATGRKILEYPHARHTLEFEPDRDRFIDDVLMWLRSFSRVGAEK